MLGLQWVDLHPGIVARSSVFAGAPREVPERLSDPFWAEAVRTYTQIRAAPAANAGPGWDAIGVLAARAGLPTDCIYLARVDRATLAALRAKVRSILGSGAYEPGTLYVLRDEESLASAGLARPVAGSDPTSRRVLGVGSRLAPTTTAQPVTAE